MAEDLGQEDVVGLVSGFKLVAADSSVGTAEVAWFPGFVQRAEGGGNVLGQLRAGGGVTVVVLTASALAKVFKSRSRSRAPIIFFGSARTGIG